MQGNQELLEWQRAVIRHLVEYRPADHKSIWAVSADLAAHAADGALLFPSRELISWETGQSHAAVRRSLAYLAQQGLLSVDPPRPRDARAAAVPSGG